MPAQLREERLEDEVEDKLFPLKNGGQIGGNHGQGVLENLRDLLEDDPQLFQALLAIVQGRPQDATPEAVSQLRSDLFLRADNGAIRPDIRDVLLSAYNETAEGPVLVNPFVLTSSEQPVELERMNKEANDRLLREIFRKGNDKGPSTGRG